jgi:hypothetical protein
MGLLASMFEEPVRYLTDIIQHNRPIWQLIEGTDALVDRRLAEHYGFIEEGAVELPGPFLADNQWQRIRDVTNCGRGGILTMGVFLTKNSPGLRTSPVKRGSWVVRQLLGERIPPPPPTVPELPNDEASLHDQTLRTALARHREHASCAGCHDRFDALGLVFEGFDPVGRHRDHDLLGREIDDSATFPDGISRQGVSGLKDYLLGERRRDFVENFCRKLLSFGLGRSLYLSDDLTVAELVRKLEAEQGQIAPLIEAIVTHDSFLKVRVGAAPSR